MKTLKTKAQWLPVCLLALLTIGCNGYSADNQIKIISKCTEAGLDYEMLKDVDGSVRRINCTRPKSEQ